MNNDFMFKHLVNDSYAILNGVMLQLRQQEEERKKKAKLEARLQQFEQDIMRKIDFALADKASPKLKKLHKEMEKLFPK